LIGANADAARRVQEPDSCVFRRYNSAFLDAKVEAVSFVVGEVEQFDFNRTADRATETLALKRIKFAVRL
jgi:hypothetical protein